jgi:FixJ family two-component response regulator
MPEPAATVFVVEDDPSVREALAGLIRSAGWSVEVFDSAHEFLARPKAEAPSCLVLDVGLPGLSGLDLQARMVGHHNDVPIVFITGHGDIPMSVAAMKAGAVEFLTKPFRDQDFLDAVHRGIRYDRDRRAKSAILADLQERFNSLTPREREVMALVVAGRLNKQIAAELQLSEITVKVHRARVMVKMQAKSLPELVRNADKLTAGSLKF